MGLIIASGVWGEWSRIVGVEVKVGAGGFLVGAADGWPIFHLTKGEVSRNIRATPNGKAIGKMNEVGDHSAACVSTLITTYDDGKTYWAFSEAFLESNPKKRIKGWVEVGTKNAIEQYDRPSSNDVWYKF
jgi:hypothetical protein